MAEEYVPDDEEFERAEQIARDMAALGVPCSCTHVHLPDDEEDEGDDEGEEDEEDDEPSRSTAFDVMTPTQFNAHRLEAWEMAYTALHRKDGNERSWGDDYKVDPSDVLILARFIEGDDLGD